MFVMCKVSIWLSLFRFTVYIALACTEIGIKKQVKIKLKKTGSGCNADTQIKVPLMRTQSCESFFL